MPNRGHSSDTGSDIVHGLARGYCPRTTMDSSMDMSMDVFMDNHGESW